MERLIHERSIALGHTIDTSTKLSYQSATNSFLTFCALHHLPTEPSANTLSLYIVWLSSYIEPRSVTSYLSGICHDFEPFFPDIRNVRKSSLVVRTLKGCLRLHSNPIRRKRALTYDDLRCVEHALTASNDHDDILFLALLFTGFHALLRLGELVWPDDRQLQNIRKVTLRSSLQFDDSRFEFTLPAHKADAFFEGSRVIVNRSTHLPDAFNAVRRYLTMRDRRFSLRWELWLRHDGSIPRRAWFLTRLRYFFTTHVAGHSMRAGGATALAEAGVAPSIIQAIGRWRTDTWTAYVRKHPALFNAFIHTAD